MIHLDGKVYFWFDNMEKGVWISFCFFSSFLRIEDIIWSGSYFFYQISSGSESCKGLYVCHYVSFFAAMGTIALQRYASHSFSRNLCSIWSWNCVDDLTPHRRSFDESSSTKITSMKFSFTPSLCYCFSLLLFACRPIDAPSSGWLWDLYGRIHPNQSVPSDTKDH